MNKPAVFVIIIVTFFLTCKEKPTAPDSDNIFDPQNSETAGNPFDLTAAIDYGGVYLTWQAINAGILKSYRIYRSERCYD